MSTQVAQHVQTQAPELTQGQPELTPAELARAKQVEKFWNNPTTNGGVLNQSTGEFEYRCFPCNTMKPIEDFYNQRYGHGICNDCVDLFTRYMQQLRRSASLPNHQPQMLRYSVYQKEPKKS
ncbi:MAG: hypothetical protein HY092_03185 [Candidatus Kerfeldbacteria bacterium]|nr:hypothetical protein [Candidatus Kerfeldbacteria bacterium]